MSERLAREEILWLLYKACCLYVDACGSDTPDWVRIISGANIEHLEAAVEIARDDYSIEETGEI